MTWLYPVCVKRLIMEVPHDRAGRVSVVFSHFSKTAWAPAGWGQWKSVSTNNPHLEWSMWGLYRWWTARQHLSHFPNQSRGTAGQRGFGRHHFGSSPQWSRPRYALRGNAPSSTDTRFEASAHLVTSLKKRKVDFENRQFDKDWKCTSCTLLYFYFDIEMW